jgi:hypothetical protein
MGRFDMRVTRRRLLKASLVGVGGIATAATGLVRLEAILAAPTVAGRWRQLTLKTAPSPRAGAAMAYDAARRTTTLFSGGGVIRGGVGAETWTWDGTTWTRQNPPVSPPARSGASFAYHGPTKTAVLFGGQKVDHDYLGDTWLWDGHIWTSVPGAGPGARSYASMAFDPSTGGLILFGGYDPSELADTWKWDGKSWQSLSPKSSPDHVKWASFAYSASMGKLILFGGSHFRTAPGDNLAWAWDGTTWSGVTFDPSPPGRGFAAMASAPDGGVILLFGGTAGTTKVDDQWTQASGNLGDTWTFTKAWSQDTQTPAPTPRYGAALVPDPSGNSFLLFGGETEWTKPSNLLGDTWTWGPY